MSKPDLLDSLFILNETDRPCMYLVCRKLPSGKIIYVNNYLRRRYMNLQSNSLTCLSDYGFIFDEGKYILKNPSKVRYTTGHQIRHWQGRKSFTYDDIINFDGRSSDEGLN